MIQELNSRYWDSVAFGIKKSHLEKNIAIYKKHEHIRLIKGWAKGVGGKRILKTDLYEEAFGTDNFLFWVAQQKAQVFAADISRAIAAKAKLNSLRSKNNLLNFSVSDIRNCAFKDDSFDLIISNSTLDNLAYCDIRQSLYEMKRILKPDGLIILTLDNAHNPLYTLGYIIEKLANTNKYYQDKCYSLREAETLVGDVGLIVEDSTAIVHIPTPFNKIALILKGIHNVYSERIIRRCISLFSNLGRKRTKFLTGWFIALKIRK